MVFQKAIEPTVVSNIYSKHAVEENQVRASVPKNLSSRSAIPEDQKTKPKIQMLLF